MWGIVQPHSSERHKAFLLSGKGWKNHAMKIIERIERDEPSKPGGGQFRPRTLAILAVLVIVALMVAGVLTVGPLSPAFFMAAFGVSLWTVMIGGAFEVDRRRRLNYLRGR